MTGKNTRFTHVSEKRFQIVHIDSNESVVSAFVLLNSIFCETSFFLKFSTF